ncbi:MAG: addiction module protein [Armatimonadetes bacterium]|nr:addiction module protein [Armatimonadota bacterium]
MVQAVENVVLDALALPAPTRAFVAERLIESLDAEDAGDLSPAWQAEIARRSRGLDEGPVELRAADEVFDQAFAALR